MSKEETPMTDVFSHCDDAALLTKKSGCSVYEFRNETGEGRMTIYDVFPGVTLAYNDFHMQYYDSDFHPGREILCIDHCREGRLEYAAKSDAYSYVEAGDLKLDRRLTHTGRFVLPLSHYHGAMISFDLAAASRALPQEIRDFPVDVYALQEKYCRDKYPLVIHGMDAIEHIFSELYAVPQKIRLPYFKVKIMELLLYLDALELPESIGEKPYFYKAHVEKTKAVRKFLEEHPAESYTQEELAERFGISLTTLKKCFRSIYGTAIGMWLAQYRMNRAAVLLKTEKDYSVAQIAGMVGYDSPSKFSAAFRKAMGMSPAQYRKIF